MHRNFCVKKSVKKEKVVEFINALKIVVKEKIKKIILAFTYVCYNVGNCLIVKFIIVKNFVM